MKSPGALSRWLPVVAYAILVFIGSSLPGTSISPEVGLHDKVIHATEYAGLGFLLARAFGARRWWLAIVVGLLYGVSDEFHQTFTPHRSGNDLGDMTADLIGSILGATVWRVLRRPLQPGGRDGTKSA